MANKRILLVDYDPKSLTYTRDLLQKAGFEVSTCADGLSALDQFRSVNPDLVLLSAMLPKMHGFEVCNNIRKLPNGTKTPVVIITDVYKGKRYRFDAMNKYGATEYVEKPIEDSNLLSLLQNLIGNNGLPVNVPVAPSIDDVGDNTVSISREEIMKAVNPAEKTFQNKPSSTPPAKKPEKPRTRDDDVMDRKLEESLAGLRLDFGRGSLAKSKPKSADSAKSAAGSKSAEIPKASPKPLAAPAVPHQAAQSTAGSSTNPGVMPQQASVAAVIPEDAAFTSEDLFNDVIASVEKELEHEKIITNSGVKEKTGAITNPLKSMPPAVASKSSPKLTFEEELEKKISSTLSGILKDKPKTEPAPVPPKPESSSETKEEPPSPPTVQLTREFVQEAMSAASVSSGEGINFGQYLLLSKIASGGMAELFKAKRKGVEGFEKILAIKRILPHMSDNEEFITMFIDEAKLAAQLTHHNICQIFDLGKIENSYYIAMEFVHGKDLRAVLRAARVQQKSMPIELAILITSKICSALDYAHRKNDMSGQPLNLVHRDVSPQNILISYEGDVKLVDFGIAKAATKAHVTQHGALKGKLLYMSPEQAWGKSVDRRSDVFSVGGVLYEMLAGRPLFFAENDTEVTILEKVREAHITPIRSLLPGVPQELEKILGKALQKNPEERYQIATDMQKDLDNLFYTEGYNATSASLANFARGLFPEDWVHESGGRETIVLSKDVSEAMKAQLAEKTSERPSDAASKTIPPIQSQQAPKAAHIQQAPQPAPPPAATTQPSPASASAQTKPFPSQPKSTASPAIAATAEAPAKRQPATPQAPSVTAPTQQLSNSGFREISLPEILPPQPAGGSLAKFLAGGIALALIVGGLLYFLFRPKPADTTKQNQPKQTQQAPAVPTDDSSVPVTKPDATAMPLPIAEDEKQKQDLLRRIDEEKKKMESLKAAELKKKDDQQKLDEQKNPDAAKLEEQKKEEARILEEQRLAEEQQKADADKAVEEQRLRDEAAAAEQTRLAQLQQEQQTPVQPATQDPAQPILEAPQQPVVNEGDLVEVTPDVTKPVLTKKVEAEYPHVARQKKVEGTVILQLLVNENGQVADVKVLRPAGGSAGLTESAIAAVRKWVFQPAVKAGKRVKVLVTYPIHFKLQN